jgi:hypothetical protein
MMHEQRPVDFAAVAAMRPGLLFHNELYFVVQRTIAAIFQGANAEAPDVRFNGDRPSEFFEISPHRDAFLFHHINDNHWTISYHPAGPLREVFYFDSSNNPLNEQSARLYMARSISQVPGRREFTLTRIMVPPQPDGYSCGLRTVATVVLLLSGMPPQQLSSVSFDSACLVDWFQRWVSREPGSELPPYEPPSRELRITLNQQLFALVVPPPRPEDGGTI